MDHLRCAQSINAHHRCEFSRPCACPSVDHHEVDFRSSANERITLLFLIRPSDPRIRPANLRSAGIQTMLYMKALDGWGQTIAAALSLRFIHNRGHQNFLTIWHSGQPTGAYVFFGKDWRRFSFTAAMATLFSARGLHTAGPPANCQRSAMHW
jgi:hypothetical protein